MGDLSRFRITEREDGSLRVQTVNEDPEMTKQSFKDECDINFILRDYERSGVVRSLNKARAVFADVSELGDYADALMVVQEAEEAFMALPAKTRKVFNHSPAEFLDAAHDPDKRDLLVQAGLIPPEKAADAFVSPEGAPGSPEPSQG